MPWCALPHDVVFSARQLFVFYRLMRPEFVRDRGRGVLRKLKLPDDHEFPKIVITNPMKFAIEYAKLLTPEVTR